MNRAVLITGASGGLGSHLALAFGKQSDDVLVHYRSNPERAELIAQQIRSMGAKALTFSADLRNNKEVHEMAMAGMKAWGRIDVWINNAGITIDRSVESIGDQEWDQVIRTNLSGAFYGIQEAARIMAGQRQGHIINIASLVGIKGASGQAAYAASKAGLIALTKTAAKELGPYHIQVNVVLPGYLSTPMTRALLTRHREAILSDNVLGRGSDFHEVAQFILHLSKMKHVSGQIFNLDSRIL